MLDKIHLRQTPKRFPARVKRTWRKIGLAAAALLVLAGVLSARSSGRKQVIHFNGQDGAIPATLAELNAWYAIPSGAPNAATFYVKGFHALELSPHGAGLLPLFGNGQIPAIDAPVPVAMKSALAGLLTSNRKALQLLEQGSKCSQCRYPLDLAQGYDLVYRPIDKLEKATFLLALAALCHADSNQPDAAAHDLFNAFSLANSLAHVPSTFAQLLRRRINRCALDALEQTLNRVALSPRSASDLFRLLAKMEAAEARGEFFRHALAGERAMSLAALADPPQLLRALGAPDLKMSAELRRKITARLQAGEPLTAERIFFESAFQQLVTARSAPFPHRLKADLLGGELAGQAEGKGLFVLDLLLPSLGRRTGLEAQCLAQLRLGCTALALEQFRAAHGDRYPQSLAELTPSCLESIPVDPYQGEPLRYRNTGNGFTLSSRSATGETTFSVNLTNRRPLSAARDH